MPARITKRELTSSNVKSAMYDNTSDTLTITFKKGNRKYEYNVPKTYFDRITTVKSPGKFVHKNLKPLGGKKVK